MSRKNLLKYLPVMGNIKYLPVMGNITFQQMHVFFFFCFFFVFSLNTLCSKCKEGLYAIYSGCQAWPALSLSLIQASFAIFTVSMDFVKGSKGLDQAA